MALSIIYSHLTLFINNCAIVHTDSVNISDFNKWPHPRTSPWQLSTLIWRGSDTYLSKFSHYIGNFSHQSNFRTHH